MYLGQLGNKLKNGDDHRPDEVQGMMRQLWSEYVAQHPTVVDRR